MATFLPIHPLEGTILEIIAAQNGISTKAIYQQLRQDHNLTVTLNSLYKPINKMIEGQMLAKSRGKLYINNMWLQHIEQFIQLSRESMQNPKSSDITLPLKPGERIEFSADSLQGLDPIWNHILTKLAYLSEGKKWYTFDSHCWHPIGMRDTETRLYKSILAQNIDLHVVYGNSTFLDTYGSKLIKLPHVHTAVVEQHPFLADGHAIWICEDHIVESVFPDIIMRNFSFFFQTVDSIEQFEPELFSDVFKMKAHTKINVRRDKEECDRLRTFFEKIF